MAIKIVRKEGDPVLRQVAKPVPEVTSNIQKLLNDMADTMYENIGIGLAANQIGILKRCIVADVGEESGLIKLVNPEVVHAEGEQLGPEGCLSIPGATGDVLRAARVTVKGLNEEGKEVEIKAEGLLARCLLHEIDHLNGILFTDHVRRMGGSGKYSK
ncbi:peptide deformylase [Tumebacillus sp. ITR2]|uniref:Peptide deformylase n=1 Tax=Tumebacillus amylolyticus TaxID=2801339 RepID=A0ABS1JEW1_9BACL|nr:peptide deformylase [Tumebacillus amylolyticus]MBL0388825.1 peptide deformylase [Tumebacillus amylolyticus]